MNDRPDSPTTAKVIQLRVSVGTDDERNMQDFVAECKAALYAEAEAKNVTVLGEQYIVDGQVKAVAEVEQPEPEPEPEPDESESDEQE